MEKNKLYYGDNLEVLRQHVKDESVDLEVTFKKAPRARAAAQKKEQLPFEHPDPDGPF
ncbi:MAG: hypothetical protein ACLPVW_06955 [Terriglobales bacterium]